MASFTTTNPEGEQEDDEPESEEFKTLSLSIERVFVHMGLSRFSARIALQYLISRLKRPGGLDRLKRAVDFLLDTLNQTRQTTPTTETTTETTTTKDWQSGCPNRVRGLRAHPLWDTSEFPWIQTLEASIPAIVTELEALKGNQRPSFHTPGNSDLLLINFSSTVLSQRSKCFSTLPSAQQIYRCCIRCCS